MSRFVVACALVLAGCSSGSVGRRANGAPACGVSSTNLIKRTVSVDRGVATYSALWDRQVASVDGNGTIYRKGLWDSEAGSCRGGRLTIKGLLSDTRSEPIDRSSVVLPGLFSPTVYRYTASCSPCEAALGAFALHELEDEDDQQNQQAPVSSGQPPSALKR